MIVIKITLIETVYPAPDDDEDDYCPDGEASISTETVSFRELVELMREYSQPWRACVPAVGATYEWLSQPDMEQDMFTGEYTERTLHYSHDNAPRWAKYWRLAMVKAGIVRS
jgi:hypothetical protein